MERCLASIITRHSPRFYIGSRNGTRHLSSTSPICAQAKTSPAANKARSDISHFDEQHKKIEAVLREVAHQIATLMKQNASHRMERALSNATSEFQFCGDIIVEQSKSDAIVTAVNASSKSLPDIQHIVIFIDGSLAWKANGKSGSIAHLGASVVYKSPEGSQDWQVRSYLAISKKKNSALAEMFAISQGLAVATELMMHLRLQNGSDPEDLATKYRVTIFSDCQGALGQVKNLRDKPIVNSQVCGDPIISKIITRSQYLRRIRVRLELCWVPGHSGVEGNELAHRAAYLAAKSQDTSVPLDEGLRLIGLEATSDE